MKERKKGTRMRTALWLKSWIILGVIFSPRLVASARGFAILNHSLGSIARMTLAEYP